MSVHFQILHIHTHTHHSHKSVSSQPGPLSPPTRSLATLINSLLLLSVPLYLSLSLSLWPDHATRTPWLGLV